MAVNMCLPLAKFSHALGMDANKVPWTHIAAKEMFVILKGHLLNKSVPLLMTVMQGTSRLDVIDIAARLADAKQFQASKEQTGSSYQVEQMPFFGLKRDTVLALRYYIDEKARRVQLAFNSVEDCDQIVRVLAQLGMQIKERPRPSTARPRTQQEDPPLNAQTSSHFPAQHQTLQPSPFSVPDMEAGSLSQHPPCDSRGPTQPIGSTALPTAAPTERQVFTRDESLLPRTISPVRPSNEDPWESRTVHSRLEPSQAPRSTNYLNLSTDTAEDTESRSRVANMKPVQGSPEHFMTGAGVRPLSSTMPPQHDVSSDTISAAYYTPLHSGTVHPPSSTAHSKPSLAALETLEAEIPPRRELPFKVPGSRGSTSSRPGSSALSLPPLKRPTTADLRPSTAMRPKTASGKTLKSASKKANEGRPSTSHSIRQSTKEPLPPVQINISYSPSKRPMQDMESSSHSQKVVRVSSLIDAPHELESPPGTSWAPVQEPSNPVKTPGNGTAGRDAISEAFSALSSSYQVQDAFSLEEYAAQDAKTRQAALEQFMVDNLQNPSFTTLCEDMESCWQRIALGL